MTMETVRDMLNALIQERHNNDFLELVDSSESGVAEDTLVRSGILDARVIRGTCPTCGDAGKPPLREATRVELNVPDRELCPDCANVPITVIEPAAWEAAVCRMLGLIAHYTKAEARAVAEDYEQGNDFESAWGDTERRMLRTLQVLLPGARVAEEVVEFVGPSMGFNVGKQIVAFRDGDTIAILATQAREELEE